MWHEQNGWNFYDGFKTVPMDQAHYNDLVGTLEEMGFGVTTKQKSATINEGKVKMPSFPVELEFTIWNSSTLV